MIIRGSIKASVFMAVLAASSAFLPTKAWSRGDHDDAWQALAAGQIQPLPQILQHVARVYPGQVLEVELEQEAAVWIYEVKVLQAGGRLVKVVVDARTGKVLGTARDRRRHNRHRPEES